MDGEKKELPTVISDLLDIIHMVIIKEKGENDIILDELQSIDKKLKSGQLPNYEVNKNPLYRTIINSYINTNN